jgi:hypothetical protein
MAQFSVPQFTDVEDKIIGPLTLRQFFILFGGGVILIILYRVVPSFFLFIVVGLPVVGASVLAAFGKYNGKPVYTVLLFAFGYFFEPHSYVFHRQTDTPVAKAKKAEPLPASRSLSPEERLSRLHKLTYVLDQEHKAEEELIKEKYLGDDDDNP